MIQKIPLDLPVKNQGFRSVCITYAIVAVLEILNLHKEGKYTKISEREFLKNFPNSYKNIFNTLDLLKKEKIISNYNTFDNIQDMKSSLNKGFPLISIMNLKTDLLFHRKGIYKNRWGRSWSGHAVTVIGYNDEKGAWLIKNSWSRLWGENGYAWVAYNNSSIDFLMWRMDL